MAKRYRVTLTAAERDELTALISKGKADARKLAHARILLQADESDGGPGRTDAEVAESLDTTTRTCERVRERFVGQGWDAALLPKPSGRAYARRLDGAQEAKLIALACSAPPAGKRRWTLRLLADRMVELSHADAVSHETVRQTLEKNEIKPHLKETWCIPAKRSAEFVYHMEDVPAVYHRPYDPRRPVVCVDETFKRLIGEARDPLPPAPRAGDKPGRPARHDGVYTRNGVASVFMAFEPLAGWRHAAVTGGRTAKGFAAFVRGLLDGRYRDADKVVLVMDQLNTHTPASLYALLPPAEARRLADRLEVHLTPKHGSWLDMAEVELSALARDLPERVGDEAAMVARVAAWEKRRNDANVKADWQFTTADARVKLRKLYPTVDD